MAKKASQTKVKAKTPVKKSPAKKPPAKKTPARAASKKATRSKTVVRWTSVPTAAKAKKTMVRNSAVPKSKPTAKPSSPIRAATAAAAEITFEMIATRAYFIAQSGGGGSEHDNWARAEWELRSGSV